MSISWLADNQQKGISAVPALTVHASGPFSRRHFDNPPEEVAALLIDPVRPWIDGDPATAIVERSLHRWKFATPTTVTCTGKFPFIGMVVSRSEAPSSPTTAGPERT